MGMVVFFLLGLVCLFCGGLRCFFVEFVGSMRG